MSENRITATEPKITRKELDNFNDMIKMEKVLLEKIMDSHDGIYNVYYNAGMIIIQFRKGRPIESEYLEGLHNLVDYVSYRIDVVTVTEEFFKIKYDEEILQLTIVIGEGHIKE